MEGFNMFEWEHQIFQQTMSDSGGYLIGDHQAVMQDCLGQETP